MGIKKVQKAVDQTKNLLAKQKEKSIVETQSNYKQEQQQVKTEHVAVLADLMAKENEAKSNISIKEQEYQQKADELSQELGKELSAINSITLQLQEQISKEGDSQQKAINNRYQEIVDLFNPSDD